MPKNRESRPAAASKAARDKRAVPIPTAHRVKTVAGALAVSTDHIFNLIAKGVLPALRLPGKGDSPTIVILDDDLKAFPDSIGIVSETTHEPAAGRKGADNAMVASGRMRCAHVTTIGPEHSACGVLKSPQNDLQP